MPAAELSGPAGAPRRSVPASLEVDLLIVAGAAEDAAVLSRSPIVTTEPAMGKGSPIRVSRARLVPRVDRVQLSQVKRPLEIGRGVARSVIRWSP